MEIHQAQATVEMHCTSAHYQPGLKIVDPAPVPGVAAGLLTLSSPSVVANWTDRGRFEIKACFVDDAGANWQFFLRSVGQRLSRASKGLPPSNGKGPAAPRTGNLLEDSDSSSEGSNFDSNVSDIASVSGSDSNSESDFFDL